MKIFLRNSQFPRKLSSKQASRSSTRVCVRICVSIRRPEFECSGPQLEGPEFECSGPQLEGPEFEYSELSLKLFNDAVPTTRLFSIDGICNSRKVQRSARCCVYFYNFVRDCAYLLAFRTKPIRGGIRTYQSAAEQRLQPVYIRPVADQPVVVITEDVQNVHLLLEYRPHIDVSLTCEHDPQLQEYCVCPQNMPQFDSEGIPNQAPETNKPMILNGPTSRNREDSDQKEKMTTPEQKASCVLQFVKHESAVSVQRAFRRQFQTDHLSADSIRRWYQQFQTTSAFGKGKSTGLLHVSEEDSLFFALRES
ncbi:hypothetical protein ANN_05206 [Periplaneta americana]|uniref:DUF4817 domain-containing protein n=1 Tax=Periplaneta americana TaxID=6978 RepID=A0ABQ8TAH4_PERAM|nr:hypothetical protein ANN_05206 [Periplaneta americana]